MLHFLLLALLFSIILIWYKEICRPALIYQDGKRAFLCQRIADISDGNGGG